MIKTVNTTCPYCGVGCGVVVQVDDAGHVSVSGDKTHPANFGRLCSKGAALAETVDFDGRLLSPQVKGESASWDQALNTVAQRFQQCIEEHGPESVAFYVSGQLLTEDYYVANKLMKGYIGAANIDTNSRLCMSSTVAGYKRAFGSDTVPCSYEDLERAKLIVLVGSNTAWCHPVLYQRIIRAKKDNPDLMVVVIDPRRTPTCDIADIHLSLKPGTDTTLFSGLLVHLEAQGEINALFVEQATEGLGEALKAASEDAPDFQVVADRCGLDAGDVERFYRLFARTERVVTVFSQGVNQYSFGTDKVNSIINCHLLTGRIGRPGMGPFSFTGQPNAMGGREVGGLSNQLTAHMELDKPEDCERVQRFWDSPVIADKAGYKAVDLFDAMADGRIKAVWIMATNPAVSLPDSNKVRAALKACRFVVVSDCMQHTDTTQYADVLLPAQTWGEKDGTVTNSERRISRQRVFMDAPGESKPDWWIVSQVGQRMGFESGFNYQTVDQVFKEYAELSGFENEGSRDFDISGLAGLSAETYDTLMPVQWPVNELATDGTPRLFASGRFYTDSGRAQFIAIGEKQVANPLSDEYPLVLNTGRVRDHWHTMTRTGKSSRLSGHRVEPFLEIHPDDASQYGVEDAGLVSVASRWGEAVVRTRIDDVQQPGSVFVPLHWNNQFSSLSSVDCLVNPAVDPVSGQPEFKHTPVSIKPYKPAWHGFILSRRKLTLRRSSYWACSKGRGLWRYEIAGEEAPGDWAGCARELLCASDDLVEWTEFFDSAATRYRAARIVDGGLESCVFIGPDYQLPSRDWLIKLFDEDELDQQQRTSLLTGRPAVAGEDAGRIICACFNVGINTIVAAVKNQNLSSVEKIGECLKAGTNCGSCVPELHRLVEEHQ